VYISLVIEEEDPQSLSPGDVGERWPAQNFKGGKKGGRRSELSMGNSSIAVRPGNLLRRPEKRATWEGDFSKKGKSDLQSLLS